MGSRSSAGEFRSTMVNAMGGYKGFMYTTVVLVAFIDMMGVHFLSPVILPYGKVMGATDSQIASFNTIRGVFSIFSKVWMPQLSDRTSRRLVVILSLIGSGVAYGVQGSAGLLQSTGAQLAAFMLGRAIAGLFAGTNPVLQACIQDLYGDDPKMLKQKLANLQIAKSALGLALAPIAGSIATFSLQLPYWISAGVAGLGCCWACFFFFEEPAGLAHNERVQSKDSLDRQQSSQYDNPWCDAVVLCMLVASFFIAIPLGGALAYLLPEMLYSSSFNIGPMDEDRKEERAGNIAHIMGLLNIPNGICTLFVTFFIYAPLTTRFGEQVCVLVAGFIAAATISLYGVLGNTLLGLAILQGVVGVAYGIIIPTTGPLLAKYSNFTYPTKKAEVFAIPMMGMSLGMTVSQNIVELVFRKLGSDAAWLFCGSSVGLFSIVTFGACRLIDARIPKLDTLTVEQRNAFLQDRGANPDAFIDEACLAFRRYLVDHRNDLWNGPMQHLVERRLLRVVPDLRRWKDETHGKEYMEDLHNELASFPDVDGKFANTFKRQKSVVEPLSIFDSLDVERTLSTNSSSRGRQGNRSVHRFLAAQRAARGFQELEMANRGQG